MGGGGGRGVGGRGLMGGTFQLFYINIKKEGWLPQSGGVGGGGRDSPRGLRAFAFNIYINIYL